jgi:hypothetical protein
MHGESMIKLAPIRNSYVHLTRQEENIMKKKKKKTDVLANSLVCWHRVGTRQYGMIFGVQCGKESLFETQ